MGLLDPVLYPGAMKAFAKEICRNDLLNFGRLHFFFPDSRLALDLNTDKTLKVRMPKPASPEQCLLVMKSPICPHQLVCLEIHFQVRAQVPIHVIQNLVQLRSCCSTCCQQG